MGIEWALRPDEGTEDFGFADFEGMLKRKSEYMRLKYDRESQVLQERRWTLEDRLQRCRFSRIVWMRSQMPGPREKLCDGAGWRCGQIAGVRRRYSKIDCNDEQRAESCKFGGPFEVEKKDAGNQRGSDVSKSLQSREENG